MPVASRTCQSTESDKELLFFKIVFIVISTVILRFYRVVSDHTTIIFGASELSETTLDPRLPVDFSFNQIFNDPTQIDK